VTTAGNSTRRIPHIDGLRAIAVSLVVAFHAGLPGLASGFVGVDIFFVISGFLIIGQIYDELKAGKFSVVEFYARRITRILPPLLVVITVTMLVACWLPLLPREVRRIGLSAIASALLGANWYFWRLVDYFYPSAEREPLLHLWSLGVEEQFYLVTPLLLMSVYAMTRHSTRSALLYTVAAAFICSLAYAVAIAPTNPHLAFYSTPLRAWEFLLGGMLALAIQRGLFLTEVQASAAGFLGVFAILCGAAWSLAPSSRLYVEGLAALGGGLVILSGQFAPRAAVARYLSLKAIVGLGLISYSLYLWHWPFIAFIRLTQIDPPTPEQSLLAVVVIPLALSVATYYGIERPIRLLRRHGQLRWRAMIVGAAASSLVAVAGIGLVVWSRALQADPRIEPYVAAQTPLLETCLGKVDASGPNPNCRMGTGSEPRVLLWGDSYALSFAGAVEAAAGEAKTAALLQWSSGCPPLLKTMLYIDEAIWTDCMGDNATVATRLQSGAFQDISGIVLVAAWPIHQGHVAIEHTGEDVYRKLEIALLATFGELDRIGMRVLLVGAPPALNHSAPECVFLYQSAAADRCGVSRDQAAATNDKAMKVLTAAAARFENVRFIDLTPVFCDARLCRAAQDGEVYYRDQHHLSVTGARAAQRTFRDYFTWVFGAHQRKADPLSSTSN
jgi:peptidoglycan/LPS O-acetylase OafA/YrhL